MIAHNNIIISEALLGDEKSLVSILKETWLDTYPNEEYNITKEDILSKDFDGEAKLEKWRERIKDSGKESYVCVAKDTDKIIGFCLAVRGEQFNELAVLYVLPEYQNAGTGKKLLDKSLSWLGSEKNIVTMVVIYNENAINFYERSGFVKTGVRNDKREVNGKIIPEIQLMINFT